MADPPDPDPARGVFTTLLVVEGAPVELDAHLDRLAASAATLYGERLARDRTAAIARAAAAGLGLARLRIDLHPDGRVEAATAGLDPATVLSGWERAVDLRSVEISSWDGSHKWSDRRLLEALERETVAGERRAPLLVTPDGRVLETTRATLFAVVDGRLVTPPVDARVLPGVARARVLELAPAAGVPAHEAPLTLAELASAEEAFVTNALRLVEPVRALDGRALSGPGPVTGSIAARLRELWLPRPPS